MLMYGSCRIYQFSILYLFCENCMLMVITAVSVEFFWLECKDFFTDETLYSIVIICFVFIWFTARPNPPFDLELTGQLERSIELSWIPGDENNSPITSMFVCVYCNRITLTLLRSPKVLIQILCAAWKNGKFTC